MLNQQFNQQLNPQFTQQFKKQCRCCGSKWSDLAEFIDDLSLIPGGSLEDPNPAFSLAIFVHECGEVLYVEQSKLDDFMLGRRLRAMAQEQVAQKQVAQKQVAQKQVAQKQVAQKQVAKLVQDQLIASAA